MNNPNRSSTLERSLERRLCMLEVCPQCDSPNLINAHGDIFCVYCDWNTIEETTRVRGMGLLFMDRAMRAGRDCEGP